MNSYYLFFFNRSCRAALLATLFIFTSVSALADSTESENRESPGTNVEWEDSQQYISRISNIPASEVRGSLSEFSIRTRRGYEYAFEFLGTQPEFSQAFENLPEYKKRIFLEKRQWMLVRLANLLDSNELTIGVTATLGNKLDKVNETVIRICNKAICVCNMVTCSVGKAFGKDISPIDLLAVQTIENQEQFNEMNMRERGRVLVESILKSIHAQIWNQAELFVEQNEMGLMVGIAPIFLTGANDTGTGGAVGLSISIGFNKSKNEMAIEVSTDIDRFHQALTPTFTVGITPKVGFYMRNHQDGNELKAQEGSTFYPPGAPGFATNINEMFIAGMNSSLVSFPPFIGDLFSYRTHVKRKPFFRLTTSLMTKGFVRLYLGLPFDVGPLRTRVSDFVNFVSEKAKQPLRSCRQIFNKNSN